MGKVTRLEPAHPLMPTRPRVAAYCRVSANTERLRHSLSAQVSHYSGLIQGTPGWEYAGVYVDEGVSGTKTAIRDGFGDLMADCEAGKIDMVLTKSVSRFARNTVDLLASVRRLRELGVEVRFEREGISSLDIGGELMLSILASIAQEESRSLSENVKWSFQKGYEAGHPHCRHDIYGYEWVGDDLVVVPGEAEVVRRVFSEYLEGKPRLAIARGLAAEGVTTRSGRPFAHDNVRSILANEAYAGSLMLQKSFVEDPITKRSRTNTGQLPRFLVEGHHEPIVAQEAFDEAAREAERRRRLGARSNPALNTTCFTSRVRCACCGKSLTRVLRRDARGEVVTWACRTKRGDGERCPTRPVPEGQLRQAVASALDTDRFDEQAFEELVDRVDVPGSGTLVVLLRDGSQHEHHWNPEPARRPWTDEERARASEYRKRNAHACGGGATLFTTRIACSHCGCNFRSRTKRDASGETVRYWYCAKRAGCGTVGMRDDVLRAACADALGMTAADEGELAAKLERVVVDSAERVTLTLKDGTRVGMRWQKGMPRQVRKERKAADGDSDEDTRNRDAVHAGDFHDRGEA